MKNLQKLLTLVLAVTLSVSLLAGCGKNSGQSNAGSENKEVSESKAVSESKDVDTTKASQEAQSTFEHDPVLNEPGVEPYVKEEVTITIGRGQNANTENYDTNYYTTMLEEVTGVNIEFVLFPSGEAQDKLQMMVAGGEKLPDIILWGINDALAQEWGADGYLVPLEEYFENSSIYATEGYARVKENSGLDILDYMTEADGHIWSFPSYFESTTNPAYDRMWVYGPWLEKLNLELPKTTEDFTEMLRAFKTQDPNGNGKADEIPLVGSEIAAQSTGSTFWEFLMNAFTHSSRSKNWLVSTDGQLSVSYTQDGWKEGVKYLNGLVKEGLIDPVSFTQDAATYKQLMNTAGDQLVGCLAYISPSFVAADHPSKQEWVLLEPLTGPEGVSSTGYSPDLPTNKAYITADCEHPEVAFRILDLMCREDFTITARWGKQGENWDYVADIKDAPQFADMDFSNTWLGYPAYFYEYKSIWNQPNNVHWMNDNVAFRTAEVAAGWYACTLDPEKNAANWELSLKLEAYEAAKPAEPITQIKYESADKQAESDLKAEELKAYVYEKLANWCLGTADVEAEWDGYLKELEVLGLSKWLEIQQAGWK